MDLSAGGFIMSAPNAAGDDKRKWDLCHCFSLIVLRRKIGSEWSEGESRMAEVHWLKE